MNQVDCPRCASYARHETPESDQMFADTELCDECRDELHEEGLADA